jgi:hypothetical protein
MTGKRAYRCSDGGTLETALVRAELIGTADG